MYDNGGILYMSDDEHRELNDKIDAMSEKLTMLMGHMVGINGKRGFFDEVRENFDSAKIERGVMHGKVEALEDNLKGHIVYAEGRFNAVEKDVRGVKEHSCALADKIEVVEGRPGKQLSSTMIFVAKSTGRILIGGLLVLLTLGLSQWLGG